MTMTQSTPTQMANYVSGAIRVEHLWSQAGATGSRTAITRSDKWQFFIAGD